MNPVVDLMAATGLLVLMFAVILIPLGLIVKVATRQYSMEDAGPSGGPAGNLDAGLDQQRPAA